MRIAVVNLFDPLPGEKYRQGRYGTFCQALVGRGHDVCWYTNGFSHLLKCQRDENLIGQAARSLGYEVVLVPARPYTRNVSVARLRNHAELANRLASLWKDAANPDVILVSLPPACVGKAAAMWSARTGAKLIVDVQDLWPETIGRFWPRPLRWLNKIVFARMVRDNNASYRRANLVVGVCRECLEQATGAIGEGTLTATLRLGVDLEVFDSCVCPLGELGITKPPAEKWIFLGGTVTSYVDIDNALSMMDQLRRRGKGHIRLIVAGSGPAEPYLERQVDRGALANVTLMGRQDYKRFVSLAVACDVALLAMKPEGFAVFPNRVFDYFAAGLPIVSTVVGELSEVIAKHGAGVTCPDADSRSMADAVEKLLAERPRSGRDYRQLRGEWVGQYDRQKIASRLVDLVEQLGANCPTAI